QPTFYLLLNVLTMGVTHRDRVRTALIAPFRAGKTLKTRLQTFGDIVDKEDEDRLEALGSLVLLARALDRTMSQQVRAVQVTRKKKNVVLQCYGREESLLEYELLQDVLQRFQRTFKAPFTIVAKMKEVPHE
ncbi:MAG: hypothetical protein H7338_14745, partial [Candidatus Sericytochromatia bacterium]|nr:hypothetical protein [Candidatus Sericytochromatia bacterium]